MLQLRKNFALLLLAGCLCSGFYAAAQNDADPEKASGAMTAKMKTALNLNEEQYPKVEAINLDFAKATAALRNEEGDRADKFSKMKELRRKREASLKGVLSEEQFRQFKAQQKENRNTMRGQMRARQ